MRRASGFLLAFLAVAIALPLVGAGVTTVLESFREVDPIEDLAVFSSGVTVVDSVTACAVYRTPDGRFGLTTPILIVRRTSPDSVQAEHSSDLLRCAPILQQHGIPWPTAKVRKVESWSMRPKEKRSLTRGRDWRT